MSLRSTIDSAEPASLAAAAIALIGAGALCGAWVFQYVLGLQPCPLCLEQRYAYYLAVPLAALLAFGANRNWRRGRLVAGFALVALVMAINAGLGVYHAGIEWGFWRGPQDCSGPLNALGDGNLLDSLNEVRVVRCDEVQWRFLGLSLAGYNVIISLIMTAVAFTGLRAARGRCPE